MADLRICHFYYGNGIFTEGTISVMFLFDKYFMSKIPLPLCKFGNTSY